jgi:hypothetical protein
MRWQKLQQRLFGPLLAKRPYGQNPSQTASGSSGALRHWQLWCQYVRATWNVASGTELRQVLDTACARIKFIEV